MMVPDATAFPWTSPNNPYRVNCIFIPYLPEAMLESLICTALAHRIMQTSHEIGSERTLILAKKLQHHRGKSIRLLANDIDDMNTHTTDLTLVTIITLLLSEVRITRIFIFNYSNFEPNLKTDPAMHRGTTMARAFQGPLCHVESKRRPAETPCRWRSCSYHPICIIVSVSSWLCVYTFIC